MIANGLFGLAFFVRFGASSFVPTDEVTELIPMFAIGDFGHEGQGKNNGSYVSHYPADNVGLTKQPSRGELRRLRHFRPRSISRSISKGSSGSGCIPRASAAAGPRGTVFLGMVSRFGSFQPPFWAAGTSSAISACKMSRVVITVFSHAVELRPSTKHYVLQPDSGSRYQAR